jgi:hypothetical protein
VSRARPGKAAPVVPAVPVAPALPLVPAVPVGSLEPGPHAASANEAIVSAKKGSCFTDMGAPLQPVRL